jgi:hypothetical protein
MLMVDVAGFPVGEPEESECVYILLPGLQGEFLQHLLHVHLLPRSITLYKCHADRNER